MMTYTTDLHLHAVNAKVTIPTKRPILLNGMSNFILFYMIHYIIANNITNKNMVFQDK